MKTPSFIFLGLLGIAPLAFSAVTLTPTGIFVEGAIEGGDGQPVFHGDTIDYSTFEVTTPGPVRLIGTNLRSSVFLAMGVVVEGEPFDIPGLPYLLFDNYPQTTPPEFTHLLNPGMYLVQIAQEEAFDGDLYAYDFLPVNRLGGGFSIPSRYSFGLEGPVRGIVFMEGNLNGTFTITPVVPEPSTALLVGAALAALGFTRRRRS